MSPSAPSFDQVWPYIDRVPGWMVPGQERFLFEKARSLPDGATIVEIGSFYGRSTCALGFACAGTNKRLICIDPWVMTDLGDLDFFEEWQRNVGAYDLDRMITPLRGRSHDILRDWQQRAGGAPIDFIFIDGSHTYEDVLLDLQLAFPLVKNGGWMAFHDVCAEWPGALRVWQEVAAPSLTRHRVCSTLTCGMKTPGLELKWAPTPVSTQLRADVPVHFFTELGPGHADVAAIPAMLQQLDSEWCWNVICPAPLAPGEATRTPLGRGEVRLHAPPSVAGWKTRTDALGAVLASVGDECILWDLRAEDRWSAESIAAVRASFANNPKRTGAFLQPTESASTARAFAWHAYPWFRWINPACPQLVAMVANGGWLDVASAHPLPASEIAAARVGVIRANAIARAA